MATTARRKALRDLTNNNIENDKKKKSSCKVKASISTTLTKTNKKQQVEDDEKYRKNPVVYYEQEEEEEEEEEAEEEDNDDVLDSLLLVQSDLTSLLHQIDDLLVQALKLNDTGKKGRKEIKSFARVLSEVSLSLKPWIPRLQKALLSGTVESENQFGENLSIKTINSASEADEDIYGSPEQTNSDLLISPSPLVSWRVNCTIGRSRQLFLLTPLPMSKASSKCQSSSRFASQKIKHVPKIQPLLEVDSSGDKNQGVKTRKPTRIKPSGAALVEKGSSKESGCTSPEFWKRNDPIVETTCIKTLPPKSSSLLEPISKSLPLQTVDKVYKSTPFPVRNCSLHEPSDSAFVEMGSSKGFELTSPESSKRNFATIVATPGFKTSPPNTCILLKPISTSYHQAVDKVRKSTPYPVGKQNLRQPDTPESSCNESSGALNLKYPELGRIQRGPTSVAEKKYETSPDWFLSLSPPKTCVLMEPPDDKSLHNQNVYGGSSVLTNATPTRKEPESIIRTGSRPGENTLKKELWAKFEAASTGLCFASEFQKTKQKGFLDLLEEASCDESELDFKESQR